MSLVSLVAVYLLLTVMPYFFVEISGHRITVDLSYKFDHKVMKWITAREYQLNITADTKTIGNNTIWYQTDEIFMASHTGTHLDAPNHFAKGKWSVADIPLKNLIEKPLSIIDVVDQSESTRDYNVNVDDFKQWEEINGEIPEESVVMLRTGWSRFWPNKLDYFGTDGNDPKLAHFPGLHQDAARWLVEKRKVVGVGIDTPSIDCGECNYKYGFAAHQVLSEANVYVLENIEKSIFKVPVVGATITVLPIKLVGSSGSPVRAIAQYSHQHADTNLALHLAPSHLLMMLSAVVLYHLAH